MSCQRCCKDNRTAALTVDGKPVLAVLLWHVFESVVESLEILDDPEIMDGIREGIEDMRQGNLISHREVMEELED